MSDPGDVDWIGLAGKRARGRRPAYFDDPAIDRLVSMVMALAGEVAVTRERLDAVERLLDAHGSLTRADIDAFHPDAAAARERGVATREFVARVLRGVQQDMESLESVDSSIEDVSRQLRDS